MADQNPSDAPSLPPIPMIPFQGPPPDQPAPSTPTEMAAASLSSSVDNDMPISEVVAALKNAPQTGATSVLTEIKTETLTPAAQPSVTTTVTTTPAPRSEAQIPSTPAGQPVSPVAPTGSTPSVTTTVSVTPPPAMPKGPLYEDPDLVKVPGTQ